MFKRYQTMQGQAIRLNRLTEGNNFSFPQEIYNVSSKNKNTLIKQYWIFTSVFRRVRMQKLHPDTFLWFNYTARQTGLEATQRLSSTIIKGRGKVWKRKIGIINWKKICKQLVEKCLRLKLECWCGVQIPGMKILG